MGRIGRLLIQKIGGSSGYRTGGGERYHAGGQPGLPAQNMIPYMAHLAMIFNRRKSLYC